jgi:ABC-type multidrug transport system ATPase subunit/ABC-type multidrug transport system permease subunit
MVRIIIEIINIRSPYLNFLVLIYYLIYFLTSKGIKPGVMAVMGPSGAGKTTFLDVISGRKDAGIVTGKVMLDGLQLNSRSRSKLFGYVMQEEPMVSCLTVRETLRFAADLRSRKRFDNKPSSSNYIHETTNRKDDIAAQFSFCTSPFCCCSCLCASCCSDRGDENDDVVRVIEMLSLSHVADVRVGSVSDRTLSGGERKRVSIGTELIVDPPVLLLDEPTTGLDSNSAMSVMEVLNNLVLVHSRIVVATIHQPRAAIWNHLGGVTVVSPLGTIVYTGPAKDAPNYFMLDGEPCRFDVNPADHIIDSVAEMSEPSLVEMTKACSTKFQSNPIREQLAVMQFNQGVVQPNLDASRSSRNSMSQCCILCGRTNRILFRDKTLIILQYIVPAIIGVGFGFVYRGITNDLKGIQNLAGSFFALQVFWCLVGTTALDTWNSDRSVVLRQLSSGYYRITPYYIAQGLNDIFFLRILPPIAFSLPFVMLTGQCNNLKDFSIFSCILVLTSTSFASICLSIGAILKTPRSANAVGVLVMIFSLIFGGLLVNRAVAHLDSKWYEYLYYFAPLSYSYEAMMVKVLRNANINFNPQGFNTNVKTDGSVWLANFGLNADNFNFDLIMLSGFTVVGFLLSLPLLAISHRRICAGECNGQNPEQDNDSCGHCCSKKNMKGAPSSATNNGSSNRSGRIRLSSSNIKLPLLDGASSNALGKGKGETKTHDVNRSNHVLSFTDVSATVAGRQILSNVHGEVNTKNDGVFAILGPSGAGKTSLLDIIAGRKNVGTFSGHICVDGVEFSSISKRKSIFGYVMQDETLVTDLSVRESLTFSASLRLCGTPNVKTGSSCCLPDVTSIVRQVLIDLKIDEIADSRIGTIHGDSRTRGISGGERKRVAIGMELVVNPPVLLLDEPTTGLDAAAAIAVMSLMHALVKKRNMIVMCTIHQPRSDVFHQFGKVMVLRPLSSSLGEAKNSLFYVGSPDNAFQWLESKGYTLPSYTNVADLLLDLVVADFNDGKQNGSTGVIKNLNNGDTLMSTGEDNTSIGNTHHSKPRLVPDPSSSKKYTSLSSVGSHGDHPNTLITPLDSGANSGSSKKNLSSNNNKNNIKNNSANDNVNNNPTIDTETSHEKAHDSSNGGNGYDSSGDSENASISSLELGAASQVSRKKCYCSCYWEMIVLIRLEVLKLARSPSTILVHIGVAVIMGVIIGFLYEDMQPDVYGTWNRFLGIFAEVTMFALLGLSAVGTWQNDRVRFLRERSSGYYGTLPYYLSKFFVDAFALRVLPVVLFVFCSYSLVGFEHHFNSTYINTEQFKNASQCAGGVVQHSGTCITDPLANTSNDQGAWGRSKWIQILMLSLTATSASAISSTVSAMSTDGKVGNFATVLIILVLIMFSGALVSNAAMPWYVGWLTYVSPFAFTFEAMTIGQFQDQCFLFNPTTMRALFTPGESGSIACVEVPGYIWLLQFGCTAVGHNVTWKNGYPSLDGLSDCEYTYSTIEKDIMVSIILLGCYMFLAIGLYGFCVRERR